MTLLIVMAMFAALVGLALAPVADGALARWQLAARAEAIARQQATVVQQRPSADPILRRARRQSDEVIIRMVPNGQIIVAALATAGGRLSVTALAALAFGLAAVLSVAALSVGLPDVLALLVLPVLVFVVMHMVSAALATRARAAFAAGFPDAVAIMIRSLRAGLPVVAAIGEISRGKPGPVTTGFALVVEDMRLGQPIDKALWTLARRFGLPDLDFLVVTIALQGETGGNLAETLGKLEDTLGQRRHLALKVRALAAEARASALIIGSLPFVMAIVLGIASPEYLQPLVTTGLGKALLGAGLASMATGGLIINAMLKIRP